MSTIMLQLFDTRSRAIVPETATKSQCEFAMEYYESLRNAPADTDAGRTYTHRQFEVESLFDAYQRRLSELDKRD